MLSGHSTHGMVLALRPEEAETGQSVTAQRWAGPKAVFDVGTRKRTRRPTGPYVPRNKEDVSRNKEDVSRNTVVI